MKEEWKNEEWNVQNISISLMMKKSLQKLVVQNAMKAKKVFEKYPPLLK